jgi:hypothetical protein
MARKLQHGDSVKILGGMKEFVGRTGTVYGDDPEYDGLWRVRLDSPVQIPDVGTVTDDLWKRNLLKIVKAI